MRVSKTVREYIEKQVKARLELKYEPLIAAENRQDKICDDINEAIRDKVALLIYDETQAAIKAYDFLAPFSGKTYADIRKGMSYSIGRNVAVERNKGARSRMADEAKEIVQNIIVELELGGTKADLERLLAEIGVEG